MPVSRLMQRAIGTLSEPGEAVRAIKSTVTPIEERAAAALEAREAPTQAHVSSSDSGASKGRSLFTKLGRKVLHTSPANHILSQVNTHSKHEKAKSRSIQTWSEPSKGDWL
ncbi:MAG: hypothetical protein FRX49_12569 [Trebouxia sp. A1-2]|nr:MAG: hypothetical protein FRX49_12569 [Trebouxia sp. A1-2]